ncbi:protein kinase [Corallococcus macrosporus]|uniref:Protein kinase n=1 Tax=Corallococcus macrosporus TaxID=35 RepID=A0ABS3D4T2_9BACT|nr:serine/threonine-protein kinase [Corallococcus macrosporus]MBN8226672.1 protein kinase [Corallococcus macrosporus]
MRPALEHEPFSAAAAPGARTDEAPAEALATVDPLVGSQIGEFVIRERVGAGGMGVVYRAEHPLIGKHAAIKVMRAELVSPEQEQRLLVEARAVNAIRHPGVLDIFNFGTLPDCRPYVVMELLKGQSLADRMREQGRMDVGTTAWVLEQVLAALAAAHRAGVVHRDLKPANVFLMEQPDAAPLIKLVDFGIAKLMQGHDALARTDGSTLGTPDFMAPEQVRGGEVGPAADLYALGVMAFHMLTGTRPFQGDNVQVMFAHVEQVPPRVSSRVEGIPPELDDLVSRLMAKDPAKRPATATAVRLKLRGLARPPMPSGSVEPDAPVEPQARAEPPGRRSGVSLAVAAVAAVAMLGVGYGWGTQAREAEPMQVIAPPRPSGPVRVDARPTLPEEPPPVAATQPPVEVPPEVIEEAAPTEAETATATLAKSTKLPPLPAETASEKKMEQRQAGLFKLLLARSKDVDAEGVLRGRLLQQYRAAAEAKTDSERTRIHVALDDLEKELTQRIALHDAPPARVAVATAAPPAPPRVPALVIPRLPPLPQGNASEQRLAQRMDKLVAELRKRTQNQDVAPELTKQLVDIFRSAANATTATERMSVHQALDAWQERLTARLPR